MSYLSTVRKHHGQRQLKEERVCFDSWFLRGKSPSWQGGKGDKCQLWKQKQEAGMSHLYLQTRSRESDLEAGQGYIFSKSSPSQSGVLSPARLHLPNYPNNWRSSVQMPESMRDISHANHHTNGPLLSPFYTILVFLFLFPFSWIVWLIDLFKESTIFFLFFHWSFVLFVLWSHIYLRLFIYLFVSCMSVHKPWNTCGDQRTTCWSMSSLVPMCILGMKLRSSSLKADVFTCWAISLALYWSLALYFISFSSDLFSHSFAVWLVLFLTLSGALSGYLSYLWIFNACVHNWKLPSVPPVLLCCISIFICF